MAQLTLQDLPPKWAHFCLDTCFFVQRELNLDLNGRTLLLAASRGVDSTALILWAWLTRPRLQTVLHVVHLHHGLRVQADAEAASLQELCQKLDLPLHQGHTKASIYARRRGLSLEEAGRILRYRFLIRIGEKIGAHRLLTAHHLNDLAEDVLMRQIRGTGWPALGGMSAWIPDTKILRPFLLTPKKDLARFVQACGVPWMEDDSNQDPTFARNRVRHRILPLLLAENPGFLHQTADLWRQARIDADYWHQDLRQHAVHEQVLPRGILLPALHLDSLHPAQRLRWYRDVLDRLGPGQALADTLFRLDRAWQARSWHKRFQFPGCKEIRITPRGMECSVAKS